MEAARRVVLYDTASFVNDALKAVYERECSVPEAVRECWEAHRHHLTEEAMAELVCAGVIGKVNDALSHFRFRASGADQPDIAPGQTVSTRRLFVEPSSVASDVRFARLEVRYVAADGRVRPVREFTLLDVETAIGTLRAEINGRQAVMAWFVEMRNALRRHGAARVGALSEKVQERLDRIAPSLQ